MAFQSNTHSSSTVGYSQGRPRTLLFLTVGVTRERTLAEKSLSHPRCRCFLHDCIMTAYVHVPLSQPILSIVGVLVRCGASISVELERARATKDRHPHQAP